MFKKVDILKPIILIILNSWVAFSQSHSEKENCQIGVLGMLHFVSKNNTVSQEVTVYSESQINELVNSLLKIKPTKIAVERPYKTEVELNQNFQNYLSGNYHLLQEETDQIAFRLAKELNHSKLFLAYSKVDFDFEKAVQFAIKNNQEELLNNILKNAKELANSYDSIATKNNLRKAVHYLNTEYAINKNNLGYLLTMDIGNKENPLGSSIVADWYESNFKIFQNIKCLCEKKNEKILVIYGQGHLKILNQLINDSPNIDLIQIEEYLD